MPESFDEAASRIREEVTREHGFFRLLGRYVRTIGHAKDDPRAKFVVSDSPERAYGLIGSPRRWHRVAHKE